MTETRVCSVLLRDGWGLHSHSMHTDMHAHQITSSVQHVVFFRRSPGHTRNQQQLDCFNSVPGGLVWPISFRCPFLYLLHQLFCDSNIRNITCARQVRRRQAHTCMFDALYLHNDFICVVCNGTEAFSNQIKFKSPTNYVLKCNQMATNATK